MCKDAGPRMHIFHLGNCKEPTRDEERELLLEAPEGCPMQSPAGPHLQDCGKPLNCVRWGETWSDLHF